MSGERCECSDFGCTVHEGRPNCSRNGHTVIHRMDMVDETGTLFCWECSDDAMDSGLFTYREDNEEVN